MADACSCVVGDSNPDHLGAFHNVQLTAALLKKLGVGERGQVVFSFVSPAMDEVVLAEGGQRVTIKKLGEVAQALLRRLEGRVPALTMGGTVGMSKLLQEAAKGESRNERAVGFSAFRPDVAKTEALFRDAQHLHGVLTGALDSHGRAG